MCSFHFFSNSLYEPFLIIQNVFDYTWNFQGKYTNEGSEEWSQDKLDQKIKNGEEWYIIFDKSQINSDVCNYFSKVGGIGDITFPTSIVLAMEAEPEVQIKKTKKETLEFLKSNDPVFII
ncbi:hypothetical protein [endosymbiont GvMRE of Glomus versiforme]|uniref:hypothetical protein n=1 Tax=endosymbiont GvMRE of Glomus versiforme TaxID=2039283 RepID=UPI0011C402FA|nr:hypothetical protein [endosymbiont GvMRE of Glomus versiforme]